MQSNQKHIISIDVLRTVLAFCVMCYHLHISQFKGSTLSVDIFFILSGFVLTMKYYDDKNVTFSSFAFDRFVRIYPLFFISCVLSLLIPYQMLDWNKVSSLFLIQILNIGPNILGFPLPAWSLSVEMWIGILIFFPIFIFCRYKDNIYPVIFMLSIATYAYIYNYGLINNFRPDGRFKMHLESNGFVTMGELRCLAGMLFGYVLFFVYKKNFLQNISKITINIATLLICVALGALNTGEIDERFLLLIAPALIIILADKKCFLNNLKNKIIIILSKMSYSLYLFHMVVWDALCKFYFSHNNLTTHQQQAWAISVTVIICIPISIYLEPFLIKQTRSFLLNKFSPKVNY
jgi:peptidoglycan/LPS O-acetylase OafA/YrhL